MKWAMFVLMFNVPVNNGTVHEGVVIDMPSQAVCKAEAKALCDKSDDMTADAVRRGLLDPTQVVAWCERVK